VLLASADASLIEELRSLSISSNGDPWWGHQASLAQGIKLEFRSLTQAHPELPATLRFNSHWLMLHAPDAIKAFEMKNYGGTQRKQRTPLFRSHHPFT